MSRRAVIYARFSTELQRDRSIEDQIALCRQHAHGQGLAVVATYEDRARSGASMFGRDGLERLLADAERRAFDVVVVEALDRLSRDMADLAGIHRRLSFLGIELRAVHDGVADTVTIGLRGLVGQLFREDGAKKVRRGMAGVVRDGRHAGGRSYGYRPTPGEPGRLQIVDDEAAIVRRIFEEYAAGKSPRDIAGDLNRDRVAPPRGRAWNASTINGNAERGSGILQNSIYAGEIVWNRVRMVKDPSTGKRVSRPNPEADWLRSEAPELAIVDSATYLAAKARKAGSRSPAGARGPRRYQRSVLSGLLKCGVCGSGMSKHDNACGRPRIRCSRATESGACDNGRSYYLDRIEAGVVDALEGELQHPDLLVEYVRTYHDERQRLAGTRSRDRARLESRMVDANARMKRLVDAIATGAAAFGDVRAAMEEVEAERRRLEGELAAAGDERQIVTLHPKAVASFRAALADLKAVLATGEQNALASGVFRQLVEKVVVEAAPAGAQPQVRIVGRLAAILDLPGLGGPRAATGTRGGFLVAEVRYSETPHAGRRSPAAREPAGFSVVWAA